MKTGPFNTNTYVAMTPNILHDLYRQMYLIRRTEEVVGDRYAEQEMRCPVHLCIGHEAVPVGVSFHLRSTDLVFGTHRSHGHYLAKGGSLPALIAEFYGRRTGCSMGKGGSMHLIDLDCGFLGAVPILGATTSIAVGAAFGAKLRGEEKIVVAYVGDAAIEEGIFYESANFAAVHRLPVLFVCENNQLSVHSYMTVRQPKDRKIFEMVRGLGLSAAEGDGTDLMEVLHLADHAVNHVRAGVGPAFLELHVYRWREHCGPNYDCDLGYRSREELDHWMVHRCPLALLKQHMVNKNVWDDAACAELVRQVNAEVEAAVDFAKSSPFPDKEWLLAHEFAPNAESTKCMDKAA